MQRLVRFGYVYKAEQEGLSPKTIVNLNLFLHKALSYAVNEGYIPSNPAGALNLPRGRKPQIEILTRDEQARLARASYSHRYGIFVRLALFTGLRLGELLGLRWEDVDFGAGMLYVRRTLIRLNKVNRPTAVGENTTEIVIQTPKSENSLRGIPILPIMQRELAAWKNVQMNDRMAAGEGYRESGMVVTNPMGGYIEPRTFKDYYNQILALAGLRHFTFHALRHPFASRAMEQGMDAKTLSMILGHYSVSFTLDTYAHVLTDHKKEGMALMEELYNMEPTVQSFVYPVIITTEEDGALRFEAPDFPALSHAGDDLLGGIQYIKDQIGEEVLTSLCPPTPTSPVLIQPAPNQFVMQIPV